MSEEQKTSLDSLAEATRSRAKFSGHGDALGAAGERQKSDHPENCEELNEPGQSIAINCQHDHIEPIKIGAAWDPLIQDDPSFLGKLLKKQIKKNVDLDIGCFYELANGERGIIQAFGEKFGAFDQAPFIKLSGDERTGDAKGDDEFLLINGKHWNDIKRVVIYIYIYGGVSCWSKIKPRVMLDVPGENDLVVTLKSHNDALDICAVGGIENIRGGIKLTNYTEFFPGHEEMDRAFGFGLEWDDGKKAPR